MRSRSKVGIMYAASLLGFFATPAFSEIKIGSISEVSAWRNLQPPNNKIVVVGRVTAPNPCYVAEAEHDSNNKSTLILKITLKPSDKICIQKISEIGFRYERDAKGTTYDDVEVSSISDSVKVPIGIAS